MGVRSEFEKGVCTGGHTYHSFFDESVSYFF
jgi:hypothetical protein